MAESPPRYAPERSFPAYAYIPGTETPHPRKHPRGHSYGRAEPELSPLEPLDLAASADFRFALDLLNAGFCWEAHEVLEALWIASGKTGEVAELLKALIKLCAAGVKAQQGMRGGVEKHLAAATRDFARAGELCGAVRWVLDEQRTGRAWVWLRTESGR